VGVRNSSPQNNHGWPLIKEERYKTPFADKIVLKTFAPKAIYEATFSIKRKKLEHNEEYLLVHNILFGTFIVVQVPGRKPINKLFFRFLVGSGGVYQISHRAVIPVGTSGGVG